MAQLTKNDIKDVLNEMGVVTKDVFKRELNKTIRKLQVAIANVALSSPTIKQFNELEKRVSGFEALQINLIPRLVAKLDKMPYNTLCLEKE